MKFIDLPSSVKKVWFILFKLGAYAGCHQLPERSFHVDDIQFPVCARCTGVYIGQIAAIILFVLKKSISLKLSMIFLIIMFMDWFIQFIKLKESNNYRRLITGIIAGVGLINVYYYAIKLAVILIKRSL